MDSLKSCFDQPIWLCSTLTEVEIHNSVIFTRELDDVSSVLNANSA